MATIGSSAIILQPLSVLSGQQYPTSGNGYAEVTVNYGDSVVIPITSGSTGTSAGTSNYGQNATGNSFTGGTFTGPLQFSSFFPTRYVTVSNIQYDGNINIWCAPSNSGSNVGWRGRVKVNVNLDTSISLNSSSITMSSSDTSYQNGLTQGGAGTIYYALTVANYPNGSNINSLFAGGDSRFVARTFTTATSKPFAMDNVSGQQFITNHLPTSSSPSKTVYIYGSNLLGQKSQYLGISYTVALQVPIAPTLTAALGIIQNGFGMTSNPSGVTSGDLTYRWTTSGGGPNSKPSFDTGWQIPNYQGVGGQDLGVGVEWVGTTWQVQARATLDNGSNYVYSNISSSPTLPTYSINTGPATLEEGDPGTFGLSITNNFGHTLYWQATPTADFITSSSFIGSTSSSGISITPTSGDGTEGNEDATLSLYINNTFNALNLVATRPFTITENASTITTPGPPSVVINNPNAELANVSVTVNVGSVTGANGTLQFAQTTSNSIVGATWYQPGNTGVNFSHRRGTDRYYWARRSANNVSTATAILASAVPLLTSFDSNVTISPSTRQVTSTGNAADGQSATFTITATDGDNSNSVYRLITSNINPGWRASTTTTTSPRDITLLENQGDLPPDGTAATYTYQLSGKRREGAGGPPNNSESNWTNISGQTVTVQRTVPGGNEAISASNMDEGASQAFTTANGKLSGLAASTTYYWKVFSPGNADFSTTQGDFTTDSSGATNGFTLATVSDQVTETAETAIIRIYTNINARFLDDGTGTNFEATASFTINDTSTSTSSGGTPGGDGGTATYGLIVKNANATANIISSSQRAAGLIDYGTIGSGIPNQSDGVLTNLPEITANNADEVHFFVTPALTTTSQGVITYLNRGTGTIRIRNFSGAALPHTTPYYILRV